MPDCPEREKNGIWVFSSDKFSSCSVFLPSSSTMLCTSPPLFRPHFLHKMIFRKKTTILMVQVLVSDKAGDIGSPVLKGGTINALFKHQRSFICGSTSVQVKSKIPEEIWLRKVGDPKGES